MHIIFLGPPGAGKGTQAKRIEQAFQLVQLSTGDMLRQAAAKGDAFGERVKGIMQRGELVDDDTMVEMISARIEESDCRNGFILDGFPRTVVQAEKLDALLKQKGKTLDVVLLLTVNDAVLVDRIANRFSCKDCGASYNKLHQNPQKEGVCDICGGQNLVHRPDDNAETVASRLEAYNQMTAPLLPYYEKQKLVRAVDGMLPIEEVARHIEVILAPFKQVRKSAG